MRFRYTVLFASCILFSAGVSLADGAGDLERRFSARLDSAVRLQVEALVSQKLAIEMQALRVPSALPAPSPARHTSPVASATSARALPNGELGATRLECNGGSAGVLDCSVVHGSDAALLASQGR